jgi:RNA polymerase sigma-70 factor (ECF subfamily)
MPSDNLQELFASLSNALVLYARQWCRTPEDAVQEAFIDLANCASEPTYPKAWLYTTTRRKIGICKGTLSNARRASFEMAGWVGIHQGVSCPMRYAIA